MINHCGLVLVSHVPSGLEGVPTLTVEFSIFKIVSHIHVRNTVPAGLVKLAESLRDRDIRKKSYRM